MIQLKRHVAVTRICQKWHIRHRCGFGWTQVLFLLIIIVIIIRIVSIVLPVR